MQDVQGVVVRVRRGKAEIYKCTGSTEKLAEGGVDEVAREVGRMLEQALRSMKPGRPGPLGASR